MHRIAAGLLSGIALAGLLAASPVRAAEILEEGPGYHIIAYEAGWDPATETIAAWVAMRIDAPVVISTQSKILNSIHSITPSPGWTYTVRKSGGYNSSIEIDFASDTGCSARFKSLYKPGKTTIDGGRVVCR
jgi:hypothetical protein